MVDGIRDLSPVVQVLFATGFTYGMTALRAALVFLTKEVKQWLLAAMLGSAAGVMIAASYFSLLAPSVELAESMGGLRPGSRRPSGSLAAVSSYVSQTGCCRTCIPGA